MEISPVKRLSADDVSREESTAVAVFQAVAEGEVEPCIFQDVIRKYKENRG